MKLHESIAATCKDVTIKENSAFRVRMVKHEVLSPKDLFSIDLIQENLKQDGTVDQSSTYNFFMTNEELQKLARSLTL
jgi:hypothetical protein